MVLEFAEHQYIDVDKIEALRWIIEQNIGFGIVVFSGEKIVIKEREAFDLIEKAFLNLHNSHMYGPDLKKVRYVKRGND